MLGVIGRGATSTVYLALDREVRDRVAIKVREFPVGDAPWPDPLRAEADMLQRASHRGVVRVREVLDDGQRVALVMEHVEGASLRQVLARSGPVPAEQVVALLAGALSALAHVHRQQIVHGDLKPENILVDPMGSSKLVDFGQAVDAGFPSHGGSPGYVSPEASAGEPLDARSDMYSFGAVLYECLAGGPPSWPRRRLGGAAFPRCADLCGDSAACSAPQREPAPQREAAPQREPLPALSMLRPAWRQLVQRCMAEDPAKRPRDAGALLGELQEVAARSRLVERRLRWAVTAGLSATLTLGVLAVVDRLAGGLVVGSGALSVAASFTVVWGARTAASMGRIRRGGDCASRQALLGRG